MDAKKMSQKNKHFNLTGRELGKVNKIRDIIDYDDENIMLVDHRNHRFQLLNKQTFQYINKIDVVPGIPIILPGNLLLLGKIKNTPIIGLPGCARSPTLNGFDWVLERLLSGNAISNNDISDMGVGGLLKTIKRDLKFLS